MTFEYEKALRFSAQISKSVSMGIAKGQNEIKLIKSLMTQKKANKISEEKSNEEIRIIYTKVFDKRKFDLEFNFQISNKSVDELSILISFEDKFRIIIETFSGYDADLNFDAIFSPQDYQIKKTIYNLNGAFDDDDFDFGGDQACRFYIRAFYENVSKEFQKSLIEN